MGRPIIPGEVEEAAAAGRRQLYVPADAVVTTVTRERAERLGIAIVRAGTGDGSASGALVNGEPNLAAGDLVEYEGEVLGVPQIAQAMALGFHYIRVRSIVQITRPAEYLARQHGIRIEVYEPPPPGQPASAPIGEPVITHEPPGGYPSGLQFGPQPSPQQEALAAPVEGGDRAVAAAPPAVVSMPVETPVVQFQAPAAPLTLETEVESPTTVRPEAARPAAPALDPVTIDLVENSLRNARHEMDAVLFRTAMSPGIREQHDEFPLIADPKGRMVVGQFGSYIHGFLEAYQGTIEEGDVFLLSDPYSCNGAISHLNDWLVLMPIYLEGRLVGWASMFGHMTDVGGATPGSMPIDARTIHSEGVIIRPFKLYRRGVLDEAALQFILDQVRLPQWNRSDLMGIVAACRVAEKRVRELCVRFGTETYRAVLDALLDRNYRAIKELIRRNISEIPQSCEDWVDDDGQGYGPYKLKCTVWREGDRAIFDWSGTDPQSPAAINFFLNPEMFKMFVGVYLIMVFDPQILFNDGFYDLIEVRIPEGSLLRPKHPAALSGRTHALGRVFDVFGGALGKLTPQFMTGAGFSTSPHLMYSGYDDSGEWFQLYQIGFGGVPGRPIGDGLDGHSLWPEFTNVPNEYLESYYPLVIERYECVPDSGGPGFHRGGTGTDVVYRFLADGEISIHDDRWLTYPWGVLGGKPGGRSTKYLVKPDGRRVQLPSKGDHIRVEQGDVLHFVTWGGGGWGDPLEREPERVQRDVLRGLVTVGAARSEYGMVLVDGGERVDHEATQRLRAELRAARAEPLPVFDFGPPIQEILARCQEETGLEPPSPPIFKG